jgi:hypothetical protein
MPHVIVNPDRLRAERPYILKACNAAYVGRVRDGDTRSVLRSLLPLE